jgi:hypothetical protein
MAIKGEVMGYSIKDIENAANSTIDGVRNRLEQRSQERGEEIANHIIRRTSQGRGLWLIILWPAWLLIFVFSGVFLTGIIEKFGFNAPISWLGMIGGFLFARTWYQSEFTIEHPFWSSVFGYFGTALAVIFLAEKLGIHL